MRVWVPADRQVGPEPDGLRGLVEHVRSGDTATFGDADELLASLSALLTARADTVLSARENRMSSEES